MFDELNAKFWHLRFPGLSLQKEIDLFYRNMAEIFIFQNAQL